MFKQALIFAGGKGTRFLEQTKFLPKPMIRAKQEPLLIHIINHYIKFGVDDFYILTAALIIAIGIWFYNSPVIRMGNHLIMLFIFSVLIHFNFFKKLINTEISQKTVYSLIIFSLLFVGVKNLNRISKTENNTGNAPWPKFIKPEYNTTYQDNLFLNTIIPGNDPRLLYVGAQPLYAVLEILKIWN